MPSRYNGRVPALVALFGPKRGVRLELIGQAVIGRSSSAALQLIDAKVSREHCRLTVDGDRVTVDDLGSQNGTFVNGERVRGAQLLARGDELAIGDSLLLLDPDLQVMAARFGDATMVLTEGGPRGVAPQASNFGDARAAGPAYIGVQATRKLAVAMAAAVGAEAGAVAALDALHLAFQSDRAYVLLGDGQQAGVRLLLGRASSVSPPAAKQAEPPSTPGVSRQLLKTAAEQRRAVAAAGPVDERALSGGRTAVRTAVHATLVIPLLVGDAVAGFLYLLRAASRPFTADEAELGDTFGALVALHGLGGALTVPRQAPAIAPGPVGSSPAFARVLKLAAAAARSTSTVLITGESGAGKEEIASLIHRTSGRGAFVAVNCGAIAESLAETELFGHEKGAFTGAISAREGRIEAADGGTLFLDEIGDLAPPLQVKLLRVLQERAFQRVGSTTTRSVDLRVIAATHRLLEADVSAGKFREDLFYRLNVVRIAIPPLRERREDIPALAVALLARLARGLGRTDPGLTTAALDALSRAVWKGNARELGNVLERALVVREPHRRGPLDEDEVAEAASGGVSGLPSGQEEPRAPAAATALPAKVEVLERTEILAALRAARGVKARAAKSLGISRPTLDKKITDLNIDPWRVADPTKGAS